MPQTNDQTVITAAGDSQVRVFDIEYGGSNGVSTNTTHDASARSRRFDSFFNNTRYMNEGNTNARIFRSHARRVKRIVTESSPYIFLTCSEDGEVRQWDTRQPSSSYPPPRGGQGGVSTWRTNYDSSNVPPPLISYKNYELDLNTISCSGSQPHYIALGGRHSHCFLHDRRMLGRNLAAEKGQSLGRTPQPGSDRDEVMGQATRCVRRFAPDGKKRATSNHLEHITACKISDANPNEMVVSWSGDHIYSFDLVQTPDVREKEEEEERVRAKSRPSRLKASRERKRKRAQAASSLSLNDTERAHMRLRREGDNESALALRVRYGNGEVEDVSLPTNSQSREDPIEIAHDSLLSESQRLGRRVAKALVKLRKTLFNFKNRLRGESGTEYRDNRAAFTEAIGLTFSNLDQIDQVISSWRYPVTQDPDEIHVQQTLRKNRAACRRFVQASGTLSKVMGGRLQTVSPAPDPRFFKFMEVVPAPLERDNDIRDTERFAYDFLRAILLWLDGGPHRLAAGFSKTSPSKRYPLEPGDGTDALQSKLFPYLHNLAKDDVPVIDIDRSRFEIDDNRKVFENQKVAVTAFARAVMEYDLDQADASVSHTDEATVVTPVETAASRAEKPRLHANTARRFWGVRVARSLLMTAGEGINYEFVNRAFGGVRTHVQNDDSSEFEDERVDENIQSDPEEETIEDVSLIVPRATVEDGDDLRNRTMSDVDQPNNPADRRQVGLPTIGLEASQEDQNSIEDDFVTPASSSGANNELSPIRGSFQDFEDEEDAEDEIDDISDEHDEEGEDSEGESIPLFSRRVGFTRSRQRAQVESNKPCSTHTRTYRGHCNVKTVKDVNYYGLNDEYVVSGSDCGRLFIWDKKTAELINILDGDGEVVNVIQGHPYEPMIACSGIDHTIKIFSPDERKQEDARNGTNLLNPGGPGTSSLRFSGRRSRREPVSGSGGLESRKRMHRRSEIIAENETALRGGIGDAVLTVSERVVLVHTCLYTKSDHH